MQARELEIKNPDGLRAKKAAMFVRSAGKFSSQIFIEKGNRKVNAKSIIGILSLGIKQGDRIYLFTQGKDEEKAIKALMQFAEAEL